MIHQLDLRLKWLPISAFNRLCRTIVIYLAVVSGVYAQNAKAHVKGAFPPTGIYSGSLRTGSGRALPILVHLFYRLEMQATPVDELLPLERQMEGAYMFATDDVPHKFSKVKYRLEFGDLTLDCSGGEGLPIGLEFQLKYQSGGFSGVLISGLTGNIGQVTLALDRAGTLSSSRSLLEGTWTGYWIDEQGTSSLIKIVLASIPGTYENPADMETQYGPNYIGSLTVEKLSLPLSSLVIDHPRQQIRMHFAMDSGGDLSLTGMLDGSLKLVVSSPFKGVVGKATVTRVAAPTELPGK